MIRRNKGIKYKQIITRLDVSCMYINRNIYIMHLYTLRLDYKNYNNAIILTSDQRSDYTSFACAFYK